MFMLGFEDWIGVWRQRSTVLKIEQSLSRGMAAAKSAVLVSHSLL